MQVSPYLLFNGQCAEAFKFYEKTLGGKIEGMMTHGQSPMAQQVSPEWQDKVIHALMIVGGHPVMGSDAPPQHYAKPQGFSVAVSPDTVVETERVFNALAEGGKVQMPLQKTFWSASFGMVVDRFGTPWMVNCKQAA